MSRIKTFIIGRHPDCDLQLDDKSVSRRHAEVVLTTDGRFYITDCNSTGGTFIRGDSGWRPLRQGFVSAKDRLRLGKYNLSASRLESLRALLLTGTVAGGSQPAAAGPVQGLAPNAPAGADASQDDRPDPALGVKRDPGTGEVISQQ